MQFSLCLALVAVAGFAASVSAQLESPNFPYCPCVRNVKNPPYNWVLKSKKGDRYCYTVTGYDNKNTKPTKCQNYDLKKIEFDTTKECRGSFSAITFNGESINPSYQGFDNGGLVTKITKGGSNVLGTHESLVAKGAEVCFTVKKGCYSEATPVAFFDKANDCCPGATAYPSPPPPRKPKSPGAPPKPKAPKAPNAPRKPRAPSPPTPFEPAPETLFPYCPCTKNLAGPYSFGGATKTGNTYCWTLSTKSTRTGWCGLYDLRKIEFDVDLKCKGSVASVTFDGDSLSPSWQPFPDQNGLVFKITRGSKENPLGTYKDLAGKSVKVCVTLEGACNTLEKWGRGSVLAHTFFSPDNKCCPLNY